ncbi:J domain-containing protein [Halorubrum laminariae]|uniref:J domain-containing protein n=1 Tax=Halorubrum laminariae TaxID=1433523 RepID=A0ABD6BYV0_9EURY|nr:J domain-containing protein [Halorubrum laminariae]
MENRSIVVGMAATFIGLTALLVISGIVVSPVLLAVSLPFGLVSYFLWYQASGRLRDRVRREAGRVGPRERERARQRARATEHRRAAHRRSGATDGGFGADRTREAAGTRRGVGASGSNPRDRAPRGEMSEREAYETLGLDRTADQETVRSTYRERAKRLHPDGEDGNEEAFKELNEAYEALKE